MTGSGPPDALVRSLLAAGVLAGLEWHDEVASTNPLAIEAAARGEPEISAMLADVQTAGRGRQGRSWQAPPGSSLMGSYLLRPEVAPNRLSLLPLLAGVTLAEAVERVVPGVDVALKWPNDLLLRVDGDWCKAAGILVEAVGPRPGPVVLGIGVNVDWRNVSRPPELAGATSLAEAAEAEVDRWALFDALVRILAQRYREWQQQPVGFLEDYRRRCQTLGQQVRVTRIGAPPLVGLASAIGEDGALEIDTGAGTERVSAGDVEHLRPVSAPPPAPG